MIVTIYATTEIFVTHLELHMIETNHIIQDDKIQFADTTVIFAIFLITFELKELSNSKFHFTFSRNFNFKDANGLRKIHEIGEILFSFLEIIVRRRKVYCNHIFSQEVTIIVK